MTKPNTSCTIELPASLRSDGVRVHPGMPFGIIPDSAFGFAGIPTSGQRAYIVDDSSPNGASDPESRANRKLSTPFQRFERVPFPQGNNLLDTRGAKSLENSGILVSVRTPKMLIAAILMLANGLWMGILIARNPRPFFDVRKRLSTREQFQVRLAAAAGVICSLWAAAFVFWPTLTGHLR